MNLTLFQFTKISEHPLARLFCFHYAGGSAFAYLPWRKYINDGIDLYPFQLSGRGNRADEPLPASIETIATEAAACIQNFRDQKILFTGHSMGGMVAHHTAYLLKEQYGVSVEKLFLTGSLPNMGTVLKNKYGYSMDMPTSDLLQMLLRFGAIDARIFAAPEFHHQYLPIIERDFSLIESYHPSETLLIDADLEVYCGDTDEVVEFADCALWNDYTTGTVHVHKCTGNHFFIQHCYKEICQAINRSVEEGD